MHLLILALCVAGAFAQIPIRCTSPTAWEGRLFEVNPSRRFERFARIAYDASNERVAIREEVIEGETREFYEEIFIHRAEVGYRINGRTRQCEKFALKEPFRYIQVPENATSYGEAYVGSSSVAGAGTLVNLWGGETERGRYSGSWTSVGCVPVTDSYVSSTTGFIHWTFYDVTLGISDPNVFIPPSNCP
ncbi:mammalian ependymin-related protein 1-like [Sycon ciliatum]|uniref:mammalian ependymin-related protein 1-like n=1 Tax=Sycon ciliatum TaxID=27933 RepID=UPI0020AE9F25